MCLGDGGWDCEEGGGEGVRGEPAMESLANEEKRVPT